MGVTVDAQSLGAMMDLATGSWRAQVVHAYAALGIADELSAGAMSADELATRLSVDRPALVRLLRAGIGLGLLNKDDRACYAATPLLATLRRAPGSLRELVMAWSMPGIWLPWGRFLEAVRTGRAQAEATHGASFWAYYRSNPAEAALFTQSMAAITRVVAAEAAPLFDTSEHRAAIDLGGATGDLVLSMMERNPALRGAVLDLPHVIADATAAAEARGLGQRFSAIAGSFFDPLPPADLYLLKHVLHDWDDTSCMRILENCSQRLAAGGRIVIIESALPEVRTAADASPLLPMFDLTMLVLVNGRERTLAEYEALFAQARLRLHATRPLTSLPSLLLMDVRKA
jgi:hypothetical protein